jgi:hypothetical protein
MRSAPAIAFDYRPSRALAATVACVAVAAAVAPWLGAVPITLRAFATLSVSIVAAVEIRRLLSARYRRISHGAPGWRLFDASGESRVAELVSHHRVGAWLALDFRVDADRRFSIVLGPDNLDADTRRRLVLMLARAEVAHAR